MFTESANHFLSYIKRIFAGDTRRDKRHRSRAGLLLALVLVPLLIGVMACLPVPVGDPEKSRIDPAMSGVWVVEFEGNRGIVVLNPYDKRTWLMSLITFELVQEPESAEPPVDQSESKRPPLQLLHPDNVKRIKVEELMLFKSWLTRIKGETFMTWESKALPGDLPEMAADYWYVWRVRRPDNDTLYLDGFDINTTGLDKAKTSKEAQKIIRRHVNDSDFFDDEDEAWTLHRVPQSDYDTVSGILEDFGFSG